MHDHFNSFLNFWNFETHSKNKKINSFFNIRIG